MNQAGYLTCRMVKCGNHVIMWRNVWGDEVPSRLCMKCLVIGEEE